MKPLVHTAEQCTLIISNINTHVALYKFNQIYQINTSKNNQIFDNNVITVNVRSNYSKHIIVHYRITLQGLLQNFAFITRYRITVGIDVKVYNAKQTDIHDFYQRTD